MRCQQCAKYEIIIQRIGHDLNVHKVSLLDIADQQEEWEGKRSNYLKTIERQEEKIKQLKAIVTNLQKKMRRKPNND